MKTVSAVNAPAYSAAENRTNTKGIAIILYLAAYIAVFHLFHRCYRLTPFYHQEITAAVQLIGYCVFGIAGIILFKDLFRTGLREWKAHPLKNLGLLAGFYLLMQALDLLTASFAFVFGYESINQNNVETAATLFPAAVTFLSLAILGPVTEETVFRFIMVGRAKEKIPAAVCVIVSACCFGAMHMHALTVSELVACLPQFATGLLLAILLLKCKNPTIPALMHIMNNSIAIVPFLLKR